MISPSGKVLKRWGKAGSGPGEFNFIGFDLNDPLDIQAHLAVRPDGQVYVSDSGNDRIEIFSAAGTFISQFGRQGSGADQFTSPIDLAVDAAGNVYVGVGGYIQKFTSGGQYLWRIGGPDPSDPDLLGPEHFATLDTHGSVVMTNDSNGKVLYIDTNGHKVDAFDLPDGGTACDVTVDTAGNTFVNDGCGGGGDTWVFDRTHQLIAACPRPGCPLWTAPRFGPHGEAFALGKNGTILKLKIALP
jgi:DNA-binding beta-propeller fold protein YncE